MRLCDPKPLGYTDPNAGLGMRHVTGLARLPANCIMSVSALILKIAPRLSRGVHAKDENLGTRRPCAGTVQRLEGNVPYSAERGATEALSFNGDLRFALYVVVKLLAGMPVSIQLAVWGYFNKIDEYFAPGSEFLTQRALEKVGNSGRGVIGPEACAGQEGNKDEKS